MVGLHLLNTVQPVERAKKRRISNKRKINSIACIRCSHAFPLTSRGKLIRLLLDFFCFLSADRFRQNIRMSHRTHVHSHTLDDHILTQTLCEWSKYAQEISNENNHNEEKIIEIEWTPQESF